MKGNVKITVEIRDEVGVFPLTTKYTIERDNTYETLDEWMETFKGLLYSVGFHPDSVKNYFIEEGENYDE